MTPQEARDNIGRPVKYLRRDLDVERGVITGVSENGWVFVRYGTDSHSKATSAAQLKLEGDS